MRPPACLLVRFLALHSHSYMLIRDTNFISVLGTVTFSSLCLVFVTNVMDYAATTQNVSFVWTSPKLKGLPNNWALMMPRAQALHGFVLFQ